MFSQTTEYALRAIVWLAEHNNGPVGGQSIAEGTQAPPTFLAKILQSLVRAGLITSRRGVGGGFELNQPPSDLTVLDVVNAVDPIRRYKDCPLGLKTHKKRRCSMHASLDEALQKTEEVLSATTIVDILQDQSRPKPMSDAPRRK
ncbi:MAG: Rrf2 family transcriptional regulator [bacterium]|nr:Rrf2 family transcriptional regulator [bacterium]